MGYVTLLLSGNSSTTLPVPQQDFLLSTWKARPYMNHVVDEAWTQNPSFLCQLLRNNLPPTRELNFYKTLYCNLQLSKVLRLCVKVSADIHVFYSELFEDWTAIFLFCKNTELLLISARYTYLISKLWDAALIGRQCLKEITMNYYNYDL